MAQTVETCAAHILPHVKPNMKILDVGCGSGTLTCDFAKLVPQGSILGLDKKESDLAAAREHAASKGIANVSFVPGDACSLGFPDHEFDIVYSHQVFHHVDATAALKEMKRVTKLGGIVASRDTSSILHWPLTTEAENFMHLSDKVVKGHGGNSHTGSKYRKFSREAGFQEDQVSIRTTASCVATKNGLDSFWGVRKENMLKSPFKDDAIKFGGISGADLEKMSENLGKLGEIEDAMIIIVFCEMVTTKS